MLFSTYDALETGLTQLLTTVLSNGIREVTLYQILVRPIATTQAQR